jgi:hypothetical protein
MESFARALPLSAKRCSRSTHVVDEGLTKQHPGLVTCSTGVLPRFCECFGPRTEWAGLDGITWPTTSQSKSTPSADISRLSY